MSEVTQETQLGAFAPYLSGYWLGARDMLSTALGSAASAIHMGVGIKNGLDGKSETVRKRIEAVRKNTIDNKGSGVDLGHIASTPQFKGIPTGILPVGQGNNSNAIFARGYELLKEMASADRPSGSF